MVRIGIIGLGGMGRKHLACYDGVEGARVTAVADIVEEKLQPGQGPLEINVGEGAGVVDPEQHSLFTDGKDLIASEEVDLVDICLPTFLHAEYCTEALGAAKHVLCEKPLALTSEECGEVLEAADEAPGRLMVAQVVRFMPAYEYLNETLESGRLGRLMELSLWRGTAPPRWSWEDWLLDHERSGGGILDLHVHDADLVHYLLGRPTAVCSTGARGPSGGWDVVETQYFFQDKLAVRAGGNLAMPKGFGFEARFMVAFEGGCLTFSTRDGHGLLEYTEQGSRHPELSHKDPYREELAYFIRCLENNELPALVTPESAAFSVELVEAERRAVESGQMVQL